MAEKETIMKLKVDLQCEKCYKKVKKVLSKFPQIRDQRHLVKDNLVIIKVVCCNPEKIRDKICCKGGGAIKTIEIVEPPKPKPAQEKPKPEPEKKKEPEQTKEPEKKKEPEKTKEPEKKKEPEKTKEPEKKKEAEKPPGGNPSTPPVETTKPAPKPDPVPVAGPPPSSVPLPIGVCCVECYEGRPGGPCFQGYGGPPVCYGWYYGRPVYDSYGGPRPYYVSRCDQYFSEENASGCSIM